jgi:Tfp pilus assembly protein PilO
MSTAKLDPRAKLALAVGAPLVVAVAAWFLLVAPQRSKAADLGEQVAQVQLQADAARLALLHPAAQQPIRAADVFRLATAMPDTGDMPGILLQLDRLAKDSGIAFSSITPSPEQVPGTGYSLLRIDLEFSGNFYGLSDFLYRLRSLVGVRRGALEARGRLFSVESLTFTEGKPAFPSIDAKVTVDAYVYGTPPAAASTTTADSTTDATSTTAAVTG